MQAKEVHIQYYAILREERGCGAEVLRTTARTASQLYEELKDEHDFSMPRERLRVAINNEFQDWEAGLKDGDTVVFIPPVAGG